MIIKDNSCFWYCTRKRIRAKLLTYNVKNERSKSMNKDELIKLGLIGEQEIKLIVGI